MRNKENIEAVQIGHEVTELIGTATPADSALSYHPSMPSLTGVWHTTIKIETLPEAFYGLWSFYADGTFLDINTYKETNPGIWMAGDTYELTFYGFTYGKESKVIGKGRVSLAIKMDGADHFTAEGLTDMFDMAGKPMESSFNGPVTVKGVRMQVELL